MADDSRGFSRWRVEHARDPDTDTTPRSEAAIQVGKRLFQIRLGQTGLDYLHEAMDGAPQLTHDELRDFGRAIAEHVDESDAPSRLKIAQELYEQAGDTVPTEERIQIAQRVGETWRKALVEQCDPTELDRLARVAADDSK